MSPFLHPGGFSGAKLGLGRAGGKLLHLAGEGRGGGQVGGEGLLRANGFYQLLGIGNKVILRNG